MCVGGGLFGLRPRPPHPSAGAGGSRGTARLPGGARARPAVSTRKGARERAPLSPPSSGPWAAGSRTGRAGGGGWKTAERHLTPPWSCAGGCHVRFTPVFPPCANHPHAPTPTESQGATLVSQAVQQGAQVTLCPADSPSRVGPFLTPDIENKPKISQAQRRGEASGVGWGLPVS